MDETAFHEQMAADYKKQQLHKLSTRPPDASGQAWKNRTLVSAKLDPDTFSRFLAYCRTRGYSFNTGIKQILSSYFQSHA